MSWPPRPPRSARARRYLSPTRITRLRIGRLIITDRLDFAQTWPDEEPYTAAQIETIRREHLAALARDRHARRHPRPTADPAAAPCDAVVTPEAPTVTPL